MTNYDQDNTIIINMQLVAYKNPEVTPQTASSGRWQVNRLQCCSESEVFSIKAIHGIGMTRSLTHRTVPSRRIHCAVPESQRRRSYLWCLWEWLFYYDLGSDIYLDHKKLEMNDTAYLMHTSTEYVWVAGPTRLIYAKAPLPVPLLCNNI